jgi:hypothetical protein
MSDASVLSETEVLTEPVYEVISPLGPVRESKLEPVPGLPDLTGRKVGFVWDSLFDGDFLFEVISGELQQRFGGMEFFGYQRFGDIHGPDEKRVLEELPGLMHQLGIDAMVAGVGA